MAKKIDYRAIARAHLSRANDLMNKGTLEDFQYACLELRFCLEALVFQNAQNYIALTENHIIEEWRPQRVLEELKEADPHADSSATFRSQNNDTGEWHTLGTDKRLSLRWVRKEYQALGYFLHQPTIKQFQDGAVPTIEVVSAKTKSVHHALKEILDSKLFNMIFKFDLTVECHCGFKMTRAISAGTSMFKMKCAACGDHYECTSEKNSQKIMCELDQHAFNCTVCDKINRLNSQFLIEGHSVECKECKKPHVIVRKWNVTAAISEEAK